MDTQVGYDLEKGDWVAPYGKGIIKDFIFVFQIKFVNIKDWDVSYKFSFSNDGDGILEYVVEKNNQSRYEWPYEAPLDGYKKEIIWSEYNHPGPGGRKGVSKSDYNKTRKYIFRVRSKLDSNGNLIEARYGKIDGDIQLFANSEIAFFYYFNPSGNRSLECDFNNPLFK